MWLELTAVKRALMICSWTFSSVLTPWKASATDCRTRSIASRFGFSSSGSGVFPRNCACASTLQRVSIATIWIEGDFDLQPDSSERIAISAWRHAFCCGSSFSSFWSGSFNRRSADELSFFNSALWLNYQISFEQLESCVPSFELPVIRYFLQS